MTVASRIASALSSGIPLALAKDLTNSYVTMRQDVAAGTLERAAPGKFVESLVQALQYLETGTYEPAPAIDVYLQGLDSRSAGFGDGLRICAARVGRAMYTLRNKRSIVHKGELDPNVYDLRYLLASAQWVLAELLRNVANLPMEQAGKLVEEVQAPVGAMVEDFGDKKLVIADMSLKDELYVLLHSEYGRAVKVKDLERAMDRRNPGSVRSAIRELWRARDVEGDGQSGYRLTARGLRTATDVVKRHLEEAGRRPACGDD